MVERLDDPEAGSAADRARRRLREIGRAYVHFALREPGLFGVVFAAHMPADAAEQPEAQPVRPARPGRSTRWSRPARCCPSGGRRGAVCWSAVHGFADLHLDGPLRDLPAAEREADLDRMLAAVERGLGEPS